jgi:hypothetical protein
MSSAPSVNLAAFTLTVATPKLTLELLSDLTASITSLGEMVKSIIEARQAEVNEPDSREIAPENPSASRHLHFSYFLSVLLGGKSVTAHS